ncbi:hypothetical protein AB1Y20_018362 [Prymnesium parvum]|uniref:Uncharacterized protein n=1 Tax=Prymnesium parvum TaxID=97485 RepID=A0AB34JQE8_PRYPA
MALQYKPHRHARRQPWPRSTFGLLLRGQLHRWGCAPPSLARQLAAHRSLLTHLIAPLEQSGHSALLFIALDRGCGAAAAAPLLTLYGRRLALARAVRASTQPEGMRAALRLFASAAAARECDFLLVLRHDLRLLRPVTAWTLQPHKLGLASKCERGAWGLFNCSSDLLFVVPRRLLGSFTASVGVNLDQPRLDAGANRSRYERWLYSARGCCFSARCVMGGWGHGCYNVLAARLGTQSLYFVFSMPLFVPSMRGGGSVLIHKDYEVAECRHMERGQRPLYRERALCEGMPNRSQFIP